MCTISGMLAGVGVHVRTGCVGGLDCVSCVSDGLCVCSLVTLVVLCVCVPPSKICVYWYMMYQNLNPPSVTTNGHL